MKKIQEILKETKGETLVEVLVASLLSGMALMTLFFMIQVSHHLIEKGNRVVETSYNNFNQIEKQEMEPEAGTITIKGSNQMQVEIEVSVYKTKDGKLAVYAGK